MDDLLGFGKIVEAFERGTREIREVVKVYLEPIAKVSGQNKADELRIRGLKRVMVVVEQADRQLKKTGIKKRILNEKIVIPILDHASRETEDDLIEKWSGLLASSAGGHVVHPSFPYMLSQLTVEEARILDKVYDWMLAEQQGQDYARHTKRILKEELHLSHERFVIATENLFRLKLCHDGRLGDDALFWKSSEGTIDDLIPVVPTALGGEFVRLCRGPKKLKQPSRASAKKKS